MNARRLEREFAKMKEHPEKFSVLPASTDTKLGYEISLHEGEEIKMTCCFYYPPDYPFGLPSIHLRYLNFPIPASVCIKDSESKRLCVHSLYRNWSPRFTTDLLVLELYKWLVFLSQSPDSGDLEDFGQFAPKHEYNQQQILTDDPSSN